MTAVNDAEASADAARPLTDKQLGAKVREIQALIREKAELGEALGRRIHALDFERAATYDDARKLRAELAALTGDVWTTFAGGGFVSHSVNTRGI